MVSECRRCGRRLKTQPWAAMGVGRTCAGILGINPPPAPKRIRGSKQARRANRRSEPIKGRGVFDITLRRGVDGMPIANVSHDIIQHSPNGFEWGYGGSGPAELALNILASVIGQEAAQANGLYQQFKWDFIAGMPEEGGVIKASDVQKWLDENEPKGKAALVGER